MKLQRIKHSLMRLSMEEKGIGIGALLVLLAGFMPWYATTFLDGNWYATTFLDGKQSVIETGFSGDLGVVGFILFVMAGLTGLYLTGDTLRVRLPCFGFAKEKILLFLTGQSAFLVLLTIAIYTKRSFGFTNAELRFGIYVALIGACVGALGALAEIQKRDRAETRAFFGHPETMALEEEEEPALETPAKNTRKTSQKEAKEEVAQIDIDSYTEELEKDETEEEVVQTVPEEEAEKEGDLKVEYEIREPETVRTMEEVDEPEAEEGRPASSGHFYED